MADILIRGMETPSCCLMCPMYTISGCRASKKIFPDWMNVAAVPKDCPLVPLPEGHGRLGDLDRLFEVMGQDADRWIVDEVSMIETDDVLDAIQNAPTIIEADLEWKMKNCCCFSNTDRAEGGGEDG